MCLLLLGMASSASQTFAAAAVTVDAGKVYSVPSAHHAAQYKYHWKVPNIKLGFQLHCKQNALHSMDYKMGSDSLPVPRGTGCSNGKPCACAMPGMTSSTCASAYLPPGSVGAITAVTAACAA